jgi:hypothetical protein
VAGGVYMLEAIKRVSAMRLVQPRWVVRKRPMVSAVRTVRASNE